MAKKELFKDTFVNLKNDYELVICKRENWLVIEKAKLLS